jgi:glutathione synthase/RimK-type ligase-like ATP-grasp enzyme
MKSCAFLTLDDPADFVIDDELAVAPLADLGWRVSTLSWRQKKVPWSEFDAVVIRSTWDYWNDVDGFLQTLGRIHRESRLENPFELVQWNLSKTYLRELEARDVGIVPTLWLHEPEATVLRECLEQPGLDQLVIKPQLGANGEDAFRIDSACPLDRLERIAGRFRDRGAMVQPFMARVLSEGEFSLFYFNGDFSHAILKKPAANEFRSQEERGADILPVEPEELLLQRGGEAIAALTTLPLYARIDFVRNENEDFLVMELELIEPSMYLRTDDNAPARFARAIDLKFSS